jgi:hypothetical protein
MTAAALSPEASPLPPTRNVAQKRKLDSLSDANLANGVSSATSPHDGPPLPQKRADNIKSLLSDVLTILQWYVAASSSLECLPMVPRLC